MIFFGKSFLSLIDKGRGETLGTLYFIKNSDKLNVVHTECKLYT